MASTNTMNEMIHRRDGRIAMETAVQTSYHHRQISRPTAISFVVMTALFSTPLFFVGPNPVLLAVIAPIIAVVGLLHWIVYSMTIDISENGLGWYFGPGLWKKRILLKDIVRVQRVRIPWWSGVGIKYTPQAWEYLVRPGDGVEIQTINNEVVRLGTDDVDGLLSALNN
jgi:hypothetical protein